MRLGIMIRKEELGDLVDVFIVKRGEAMGGSIAQVILYSPRG